MSIPIKRRIKPPAILKAGSVIPNSLKIRVPAIAKLQSTAKQVQAARLAICCLRSAPAPAVIIRKVGIAAIGSTKKKIEVKATNENCRRFDNGSIMKFPVFGVGSNYQIPAVSELVSKLSTAHSSTLGATSAGRNDGRLPGFP